VTSAHRLAVAAVAVASAVGVATPAGAAPAQHFTEDVTGDRIACASRTYVIVRGTISATVQETEARSGAMEQHGTFTLHDVALVADDGTVARAVGVQRFGVTLAPHDGAMRGILANRIELVAKGGGTLDSVRLTTWIAPDGERSADLGTCREPGA
jgi:hypothetical protein